MLEDAKRGWEVAVMGWDASSMAIYEKRVLYLTLMCKDLTRDIREHDYHILSMRAHYKK